ncbi:MFS transporter [Streptomyces sp. NBC_00400]|uniref:MFS transporter n=1 Tax=Streptomyces sp. NBC_00400 TaxID=2975737 RepID=UPI002E1C3613
MARYAELFQAQGAVRFVAAGFVARLTVAMAGLALVLALSEDNGSYALAGTVTGVLGLASAVVGPQVGRLHDRYGQDRVLPPLALVFGCSMGLIIAAIAADWPAWTLFPLAAAAGASLPLVGSLVRARWTKMYRGTEQLRTCYALEGATEEAVYIVGPVLVTALATGIGPLVGLGAVLGCAVLGTLSLAVQRSTQPEPSAHTGKAAPVGVMRLPAMRLLFAVMLGIGGVFGSMEIIVVGFATEQGSRGASGLLLGVWGVSSLLAGLVYGVAKVRTPLHRRFTWAVLGFAAGLLPLLLAGNLLTLSLLLLVAGPSMSLAMVIGMEVIEQVVPEASLTEGIAWSSGGTGFGMTIGSAAGGWAVDALGAGRAFGVPAACAVAGLLIVLAGRRTLAAGCARGA